MMNMATTTSNGSGQLVRAAKRASLTAAIIEIVNRLDWVSFAELPRHLMQAGFDEADLTGDVALKKGRNVILWARLSEAYADAITALVASKRLFLWQANVTLYAIDGAVPNMPVATRPPRAGYREPHWLPACLRTKPTEKTPNQKRKKPVALTQTAKEENATQTPARHAGGYQQRGEPKSGK